jgi:Flp pilus assembly pilin Flp
MGHDLRSEPRSGANPLTGPEAGATSVEYAVMVALIAAVIIGSVVTLGLTTEGIFVDFVANWP